MLELYLIRHPETLGGVDLIKGHNDIGLKPGWETSVDVLAAELANQGSFDAFFSSDLQRTILPAERIVAYLRKKQERPIEFRAMELLRERNLGVLQGKKYEEVDAKGKSLVDYIFEEEDILEGESKTDTIRRVETFATEHLQKYIENGGRVGIVGHGWWINYLINFLFGYYSRAYNLMGNLKMILLLIDCKNSIEF